MPQPKAHPATSRSAIKAWMRGLRENDRRQELDQQQRDFARGSLASGGRLGYEPKQKFHPEN